jgi:hypothetical protein
MPHAREQIRNAVVTAVTGLTTTGTRVYASRVLPLTATDLPALCVYTRQDSPDYTRGTAQNRPARLLDVRVQGFVDGDDQSVLDDIAAEVETAIYGNAPLAALTRLIWLADQSMSVDGEGETLISVIDIGFNMQYSVAEGAPLTLV